MENPLSFIHYFFLKLRVYGCQCMYVCMCVQLYELGICSIFLVQLKKKFQSIIFHVLAQHSKFTLWPQHKFLW